MPDKKDLPPPRGITIEQAARMLHYSRATVRRMIADGTLIAWKPRGKRGRAWLVDEISLARMQAELIASARRNAADTQAAILRSCQE